MPATGFGAAHPVEAVTTRAQPAKKRLAVRQVSKDRLGREFKTGLELPTLDERGNRLHFARGKKVAKHWHATRRAPELHAADRSVIESIANFLRDGALRARLRSATSSSELYDALLAGQHEPGRKMNTTLSESGTEY